MVLREPGLSAGAPHMVKTAGATKVTLMLLLTRCVGRGTVAVRLWLV